MYLIITVYYVYFEPNRKYPHKTALFTGTADSFLDKFLYLNDCFMAEVPQYTVSETFLHTFSNFVNMANAQLNICHFRIWKSTGIRTIFINVPNSIFFFYKHRSTHCEVSFF